jgi:23S rRNA (uracil1939-C5)-methyltransferase
MKLPFELHDQIELSIERLSAGGRGVGRFEGAVVFVPNTAPADRVLVCISHLHKNFADAELIQVVEPSPMRVIPPCPVADICGGCTWQHVRYDEQLKQKQSIVQEALRKFSGFQDFTVLPTLPSPKELRYRNRIQIHAQGGKLGFHKRASHDIVNIFDCPITEEGLTKNFAEIREKASPETKSQRIEILRAPNGRVEEIWNGEDENAAQGFSQVNSAQNENLIAAVVHEAKANAPRAKRIFDFYSGSGNFSFPFALAYPDTEIQAVEFSEKSVAIGRDLQAQVGSSVFFQQMKVESFLQKRKVGDFKDCLVLLDPPRTGCASGVTQFLSGTRPAAILYVSCNPATLARDLQPLAKAGFRLQHVQPFDMFPQTDHVETLATLLPPLS